MATHKVPRGEEGKYTAVARKHAAHTGKHRAGETAPGTEAQQQAEGKPTRNTAGHDDR